MASFLLKYTWSSFLRDFNNFLGKIFLKISLFWYKWTKFLKNFIFICVFPTIFVCWIWKCLFNLLSTPIILALKLIFFYFNRSIDRQSGGRHVHSSNIPRKGLFFSLFVKLIYTVKKRYMYKKIVYELVTIVWITWITIHCSWCSQMFL